MLLAAAILASVGSFLILLGAFLQARGAFNDLMRKPKRTPGVEHSVGDADFLSLSRLQRWWYNSKWFNSAWRDASIAAPSVYYAWMLILVGSALVLSGSVLTAAAA